MTVVAGGAVVAGATLLEVPELSVVPQEPVITINANKKVVGRGGRAIRTSTT